MNYELIVIGASSGGLRAISAILSCLSKHFILPILIVQHIGQHTDNFLVDHLADLCVLPVHEAEDKTIIIPGNIYVAPGGYHMLVENKQTIALSLDKKVNYSRPSIDLLFESAANVFGNHLIGVILTGANNDGAYGSAQIKSKGGFLIVQSIETAEASTMPASTIDSVEVDCILALNEIGPFLDKVGSLNE